MVGRGSRNMKLVGFLWCYVHKDDLSIVRIVLKSLYQEVSLDTFKISKLCMVSDRKIFLRLSRNWTRVLLSEVRSRA